MTSNNYHDCSPGYYKVGIFGCSPCSDICQSGGKPWMKDNCEKACPDIYEEVFEKPKSNDALEDSHPEGQLQHLLLGLPIVFVIGVLVLIIVVVVVVIKRRKNSQRLSLKNRSSQKILYTRKEESATIIRQPVSDSSHHPTEDQQLALSPETLQNSDNEEDNVSPVPSGPSQSDHADVRLSLEGLNVDNVGLLEAEPNLPQTGSEYTINDDQRCDVGLLEPERDLSQSGSEYTLNDSESDPSYDDSFEEEDDRTPEEIARSLSIGLV